MAKIPVLITHDEIGRIISIARPAEGVKVIIGSEHGNSVLATEVDEESIIELAAGGHRVDIEQRTVIAYTGPPSS